VVAPDLPGYGVGEVSHLVVLQSPQLAGRSKLTGGAKMRDALHSRIACMEEIRAIIESSGFLERWVLLYALESLDLDQLNRVVDGLVETVIQSPHLAQSQYSRLFEERFGK
jgi:hypothetical protein